MAQSSWVLFVLSEDLDSLIPSIHRVVYNHPEYAYQESHALF